MPGLTRDPDRAPSPDVLPPAARDRSDPEPHPIRARQIMSAPVVSVCPETVSYTHLTLPTKA